MDSKLNRDEWHPVDGFEGLYSVNCQGQIRSSQRRFSGKFISSRIDRAGYTTVRLSKGGKSTTHYVHRVLAFAFVANPAGKRLINHLDGNKLNNNIDNLEWVDHSENIKHAYSIGLCKNPRSKCIAVIDICTNRSYNSIREAAAANGLVYSSCKNSLRGIRKNNTCLRLAA